MHKPVYFVDHVIDGKLMKSSEVYFSLSAAQSTLCNDCRHQGCKIVEYRVVKKRKTSKKKTK